MPLMIEKKELKRITFAENARNEMQIFKLTTNVFYKKRRDNMLKEAREIKENVADAKMKQVQGFKMIEQAKAAIESEKCSNGRIEVRSTLSLSIAEKNIERRII
jgi:Cu2+-containing amine oxidase